MKSIAVIAAVLARVASRERAAGGRRGDCAREAAPWRCRAPVSAAAGPLPFRSGCRRGRRMPPRSPAAASAPQAP